jgi:hypothetical protein
MLMLERAGELDRLIVDFAREVGAIDTAVPGAMDIAEPGAIDIAR